MNYVAMKSIIGNAKVFSLPGLLLTSLMASVVFTSGIPLGKNITWVYEKCMEDIDSEPSTASCFVPKDSDISCQGIRNPDNCHNALGTYSRWSSSTLMPMVRESFVYDSNAKMLCFRPKISDVDDSSTFFGYEMWIDFFDHFFPGEKTPVRLGAIFWSGVSSTEAVQSTLGCIETPHHIPYRNTSFFISVGQSLPVSSKRNRTQQEEAYSLTELKTISLFDGIYKKDHVNKSQPIFDFKCIFEVHLPKEVEKNDVLKCECSSFNGLSKTLLVITLVLALFLGITIFALCRPQEAARIMTMIQQAARMIMTMIQQAANRNPNSRRAGNYPGQPPAGGNLNSEPQNQANEPTDTHNESTL